MSAAIVKKVKTLDLVNTKTKDYSFERFYREVYIRGKDSNGECFELIVGPEAYAIIKQACHNISGVKVID